MKAIAWITLLLCTSGCASMTQARAAQALTEAAIAVDVLVEAKAKEWSAKANHQLAVCKQSAEEARNLCDATGEAPILCAGKAQAHFDQCIAPLMAQAAKANEVLTRLIAIQRAMVGLPQAMRELEEIL